MTLILDGRSYEPIDLDLVITKGEDWQVDLDWQQEDGTDKPVDGMAMALRMERSTLGGVYPDDLTSDVNGGIVLTDGHIVMELDAGQTAALQFTSTRCWLELTVNGTTGTWSRGRVRLREPGGR